MENLTNIYKNRDGNEITFTLDSENKIISFTGYSSTYVRIIEKNNDPLYKKDYPNRDIIPEFVDYVGGPLVFINMDANDFLFNKAISHLSHEYLNQDFKRIVTKIDVQGSTTYLSYEEKITKK